MDGPGAPSVTFSGGIARRREHGQLIFLELTLTQCEGIEASEPSCCGSCQLLCQRQRLWLDKLWDEVKWLVPGAEAEMVCVSELREANITEWFVVNFDCVKCASHPAHITKVLQTLLSGNTTVARALAALHCRESLLTEALECLQHRESLPNSVPEKAQARVKLKEILQVMAQTLQYGDTVPANAVSKRHKPWIQRRDRDLVEIHLSQVRAAVPLMELPESCDVIVEAPLDLVENLEEHCRSCEERVHYCQERKRPLIAWMLNQVKQWIQLCPPDSQQLLLDIGCGRGDFALSAGIRFPALGIVALDVNVKSLEAGQQWVRKLGVANVKFMQQSLETLLQDSDSLRFILQTFFPCVSPQTTTCLLLTGLHTCGGLTDGILALALRSRPPMDADIQAGANADTTCDLQLWTSALCVTCCFHAHPTLRDIAAKTVSKTTTLHSHDQIPLIPFGLNVTYSESGAASPSSSSISLAECDGNEWYWGLARDTGSRLCKLAEMQGDSRFTHLAMHSVNALRLMWFAWMLQTDVCSLQEADLESQSKVKRKFWGQLLSFPDSISPKNQVLALYNIAGSTSQSS